MRALAHQRGRIARVRRIQHGLAASDAAQAAEQVQLLETNRQRLTMMRTEMRANPGLCSGAELARLGELAMRLDEARQGLARSIDMARAAAAARETLRIEARRDQESAERLHQAAEHAVAQAAERRPLRSGRPRSRLEDEGTEQ